MKNYHSTHYFAIVAFTLYIYPMKARHMACFLLALLMALAVSCSKGGTGDIPIGEQELPDMVMRDATYMLSQKDNSPMVMKAATITIWGTGRDTVLEDVSFKRGTDLEGICDKAVVSSDNKHAVLSGGVRIAFETDDGSAVIETEDINWNESDGSFMCAGIVTVTYGDGTMIKAQGFSAVMDENLYEFGKILEGSFTE